jgi:hypothetical protein
MFGSTMPKISESGESVWIDGIPRLEWGKDTDNSFIRSAQLVLNSLGGDYSYDFLMGISGAAFRFHFHPGWCPSAADSTTGFDVSGVLFESLGYDAELLRIDDSSFDAIRAQYQRIVQQINAGLPIVAINLKRIPVWGIITGYLKNRPGILCRTYFDESDAYSLAEHAPWLFFFIRKGKGERERETLFRNSLEIAVRIAETGEFGQYLSGFRAFEAWIGELKKESNKHEVNLTLFEYLADARQAAYRYLVSNEDLLSGGNSLTTVYEKEAELLRHGYRNLLPSFGSGAEAWSAEILDQQFDLLSQVLNCERDAIGLMKKELGKP